MSKLKAFLNYIKEPVEGVKPFSIAAALLILVALGIVDIWGCVVLIIAGFVFVKLGHKGMGLLLCLTNLLIPDALPVVDEAIGIAAILVPMYITWNKTNGNISETIASGLNSRKELKKTRKEKIGIDTVKEAAAELTDNSESNEQKSIDNE